MVNFEEFDFVLKVLKELVFLFALSLYLRLVTIMLRCFSRNSIAMFNIAQVLFHVGLFEILI